MGRNIMGYMVKTESCMIKLFSELETATLEQKVNDFLKSIASKNYVLDIKYETTSHEGQLVHSALVFYLDKIVKK